MTTWFASDTHFAHANIIEYCKRPFANVEEMNRAMVEKWNARVKPSDEVYHLGDFSFGPAENIAKFLALLNGQVTLVRGNHDRSLKRMSSFKFGAVLDSLPCSMQGHRLLLSHKPIPIEPYPPFDYHLHGHVHERYARRGNLINVGVDVRDFEPKTLDELLKE